jgi:hypothetical protein
MSPKSSSDGNVDLTSTTQEKDAGPQHSVRNVDTVFNIDSGDLPKGYFLRPFFIGTLIASGLSIAAAS